MNVEFMGVETVIQWKQMGLDLWHDKGWKGEYMRT
jgi:hypothetical protein